MGGNAASGETSVAKGANTADRLLTVDEAAERLGTGVRFIRRLISERRIEYVKLGKHVRIADSVLTAYVAVRTVAPVRTRRAGYGTAA
ncbi:excisionase family DNA-binding protein [Streptomyces sp. NPDC058525]|uniref:excisionase family DNA-binding protein n=1 Tax=Streptomyces sp. NPDC058525 TaxID=3346538 RepID=UPI003664373C